MIHVGIIGTGFFGKKHAEVISRIDGIKLVAISRKNPVILQKTSEELGVKGYQDYRKLLQASDIDTVVIATPHHLHTNIVVQAAVEGKNILLEKPIAPSWDECRTIIDTVTEARVHFMVGHVNQFARAYKVAKQVIESGEIGDIVNGSATMCKMWQQPNRQPWHLDRRTGGGMWLTAGMHCLDRLTWLLNSRVQSVCAQFATRFHEQAADDVGIVFLRYENGTVGVVNSTGFRHGVTNHLTEITGSKGMLRIEYSTGVQIGRNEQWSTIPNSGSYQWMDEALENEWIAFREAIEGNQRSPVPIDYAGHIMNVVFAAEKSSELHQEINIQQDG